MLPPDRKPEQGNQPHDQFSVVVLGDPQWLFDLTANLSKVDLVMDRRFGSGTLSRTTFNHPVFAAERTSINCRGSGQKNEPRFKVSSFIYFSDDYMQHSQDGYFSDERATHVARHVQEQLPNCQIRELTTPHNSFDLIGENAQVHVDFGYPSLEAREDRERKMAETMKEMEHPEGIHYQSFQDFMAQFPLKEQTEEEKERDRIWKEQVRKILDSRPLVPEKRNTHIMIQLHGLYGDGDVDALLDGFLGGVPLTSPEALKETLDFYALGYAAVVNAICKMEGFQPPKPQVLLGSSLL